MYPVSELFKEKIKSTNRTFKISVQIQHSSGVLELTDKDIVGGSVLYSESSQAGEDFTIGGTVASSFEIEIFRKSEYNLIEFEGATIIPQVGLLISESINAENYFLNAPQPSEFAESALEQWEYVPLGVFKIDEIIKSRSTLKFKALDNMIEFDKPYSLSQLNYPATLYQIYENACNVCDVQVGTLNFPNKDYVVKKRPAGDYTFRDIISYVAELAGCFARCNRNGALEIKWYAPSGLTLTSANRFDFNPREELIQIKGIKFETEDSIYLAGTDEYVIDLSDNILLQSDYATVLANIFNKIKDTVFVPYESRWQGDPAIQAGDIITQSVGLLVSPTNDIENYFINAPQPSEFEGQIDRDGEAYNTIAYNTIVTHSTYKYRGASTLAARGLPTKAKGYKGSTNKTITNIIRKEIKPIGDQLTTIEQAQLDATRLIANMLGGYAIRTEDAFYIADSPNLSNAQKVWKWGIGGFGYSSTGISGPYTTAITAKGSIVANLVSAGIVTANMIQTGILQSKDGSVWINLDNNSFNLKNEIIWNSETNKVVFGNNVTLSWNNLTDTPAVLTDNDVTTITNNTISTTNILAQNLKVKSANIEGIVTANMIQTGILQSKDGSTWINLDNGSFNLKNALSYENNVLTISQDLNSKIEQTVEETAIAQNVSYNGIKFSTTEGIEIFNNVPQRVIQLGGIDTNEDGTKDDYGLVVAHSDGSKTFITKDGIKRKIGSTNNYYHYLTYIGSGTSVFVNVGAEAQAQTITLPSEYKNKYFNVYVSVQSFKVWDTLIKTVEVQLNSVDRTNGTFTVTVNKNNATYTGGTVYTCIIVFQYIVIA